MSEAMQVSHIDWNIRTGGWRDEIKNVIPSEMGDNIQTANIVLNNLIEARSKMLKTVRIQA